MEEFLCEDVKSWRRWLRKNHKKGEKVMLIRYKKSTGRKSFNQHIAMREAICFGWIDTTLKRIDDKKYGVTFVKRKKTSRWSNNTSRYGKELIKEGRMSKFGFEKFEEGLKKPTIDHDLPKNPEPPKELKKELVRRDLLKKFEKWAPSKKRLWIWQIMKAVRGETKEKRIRIILEELEKT